MEIPDLVAQLEADGPLLAAAADRAGWDAPVPGLRWDVRTLVTHVGGVHRWAADVIRTSSTEYETEVHATVGTGPGDAALLDWFAEGHADLVDALRSAPDDLHTFTFLPAESPKHFWARRQVHETAVHRIDAQGAAGAVTDLPADVAQDGLTELLQGFAARRTNASDTPATLALDVTDGPSWTVVLGGERIVAEPRPCDGNADARVTGPSSDVYRWAWNRPSPAAADGPDEVFALWRRVRVRWG